MINFLFVFHDVNVAPIHFIMCVRVFNFRVMFYYSLVFVKLVQTPY